MEGIMEECPDFTRYEWAVIQKHITWAFAAGFDEGWKKQAGRAIPILQIKDGELIKRWEGGAVEAAKKLRVHRTSINKAARGSSPHCQGYEWKYDV